MGTDSLLIYKFRGRYYSYYAPSDGYLTERGVEIVDGLCFKSGEEYKTWLLATRKKYEELESEIDREFWTVKMEDLEGKFDTKLHTRLHRCEKYAGLAEVPTIWPPAYDCEAEWYYTIDLDNELFDINHEWIYELRKIPENWIDKPIKGESDVWGKSGYKYENLNMYGTKNGKRRRLSLDEGQGSKVSRHRALAASDVHTNSIASDDNHLKRTRPKIIVVQPRPATSTKAGFLSSTRFVKKLFNQWMSHYGADFRETNKGPHFRDVCYTTASLAATPSHGLHSVVDPVWLPDVDRRAKDACIAAKQPDSDRREVIGALLSGIHMEHISPWCCPSEEMFWMKNVLIYPCTDIDQSPIAEKAIKKLVVKGRAGGISSFYGLLISLRDVVLVRCLPGDRIECSAPLYLHHPTRGMFATQEPDTFTSMALVFEAAQLEKLTPIHRPSRLPMELMHRIIDCADTSSRHALAGVSRALRSYSQEHFSLCDRMVEVKDDGRFCIHTEEETGHLRERILVFRNNGKREVLHDTQWAPLIERSEGQKVVLPQCEFGFLGYRSAASGILETRTGTQAPVANV